MAAVFAPVTFTVIHTMSTCELNLADATVMATQISMDNFETCKDISNGDIDDSINKLSVLMVAQGQIRLLLEMKQIIKAFKQWSKDQF